MELIPLTRFFSDSTLQPTRVKFPLMSLSVKDLFAPVDAA